MTQLPTDQLDNKLNPTIPLPTVEVDLLLEDCSDLISTEFKPWYAKAFYQLSPSAIQTLASQARTDGKNPPKLFSYLLKREINKSKLDRIRRAI